MKKDTGFLLVDKPAGITSHDVVDRLRKITGIRKIGHTGTLDPFATGLLILGIQRAATKQIDRFLKMDKVYTATFIIGATTETLDTESEELIDENFSGTSRKEMEDAMRTFIGKSKQLPPKYSAIKQGGKKLYELARANKEIIINPRDIEIFAFDLLEDPIYMESSIEIQVRAHVASGTYIRSLARDLGEKLGTTGYVKELRRTSIQHFHIEDAVTLDAITTDNWQEFLMDLEPLNT